MKFSGKMCFEVLLNVTKIKSFTLSLEDTFLEKPQGVQFDLPPGILELTHNFYVNKLTKTHFGIMNG